MNRLSAASGADALPPGAQSALDHYGHAIGLAFQVQDDILDVEGETEVLGKRAQADAALHKPNYPAVAGLARAKTRLRELHDEAIAALAPLGAAADPLRWLSGWLTERRH